MKTTHHISNAHCATSPLAEEPYCPIENANYRLIEERCIYFEYEKLNYQTARSNCKTKVTGKLFEPTNDFINEKVHEAAMDVFGDLPVDPSKHWQKNPNWLKNFFWIGINDILQEGKFVYDESQHSIALNAWEPGQPDYHNGLDREDCAVYNVKDKPVWNDRGCWDKGMSICEVIPPLSATGNCNFTLI